MVRNKRAALASFSTALAIILGALGAHVLQDNLSPEQLESFKTGVLYHLVQSIALLVLAFQNRQYKRPFLWIAIGTTLFSGSIYLLAIRDMVGISFLAPVLGPITPVGGLLMITGWILLGIQLLKKQ